MCQAELAKPDRIDCLWLGLSQEKDKKETLHLQMERKIGVPTNRSCSNREGVSRDLP